MIDMIIIDFFTFISYLALNIDIVFQIRRIKKTKSSHDLSLLGLSIRYLAILIIMLKFVTLHDISLVLGQGLIVITFSAYFYLAFFYSRKKKF